MKEEFNPLNYWGKLAIELSKENAHLREEILLLQIKLQECEKEINFSNLAGKELIKELEEGK